MYVCMYVCMYINLGSGFLVHVVMVITGLFLLLLYIYGRTNMDMVPMVWYLARLNGSVSTYFLIRLIANCILFISTISSWLWINHMLFLYCTMLYCVVLSGAAQGATQSWCLLLRKDRRTGGRVCPLV